NADGSYSIVFAALPDPVVGRELDPVFEYRVSADVTDLNGETRSGETTVSVGYKTLELSINLPPEAHLSADSLQKLAARTTNLSGEPEPATVTIDIYKLKAPDRLIRERYWPAPDQFVTGKEEWLSAFPHDEYRDELKKETWERYTLGASYTLRSDSLQPGLSSYEFSPATLTPGWYVIEARTKDKFGQEVKDIRYVELFDGHTGQSANPQYVWASLPPASVEPGGRAVVHAGSSAGNLFVIRKLEGGTWSGDAAFQFFALDKGRKSTEFSITEADRGGIAISDIFVKDNRYYTTSQRVDVPWTNKELAIRYSSFRDKTLPGSEEKWQVKISGHKGEKVAAEVLAGMYDASLDQFRPHGWSTPGLYPDAATDARWEPAENFALRASETKYENDYTVNPYNKIYDQLLSYNGATRHLMIRGMTSPMAAGGGRIPGNAREEKNNYGEVAFVRPLTIQAPDFKNDPDGSKGLMQDTLIVGERAPGKVPEQSRMQVRTNFAETAFFFPDLLTDSAGEISFSFTMPEALTQWKWMTLAYTKELAFAYSEKSIVTSKDLMVQPNAPRFLREGDRMELSAKIVNLSDKELTGQMELQLTDPTTNQSVDGWFGNRQANQYFTVGAGQSSVVGFAIEVPYQYNRPVTYRIVARAGNYSDGEEATLPVVSNRMLVTESLPLNLPGNGTRNFQFDKLLKSTGSETLNHHALTVEFTSNPSWYAVQALPYLMGYPYECAEQTFDRLYANALAASILSHAPRIRQIFEKWKTADTAALLSNLEKNQELKSVLLEETPWVLQAKSESQQKRNIALLFDMARMGRELESSLKKLQEMQSPGGGFVWFKGGPDDRYITQVILTGIGHLQKLGALPAELSARINELVANALPYLDKKIKEDYEHARKMNKAVPRGQGVAAGVARVQKSVVGLDGIQAQYLYMRSFFNSQGIPGDVFPAVNYYRKQAQQSWLSMGRYVQGMIALALNRTGDVKTAKDILASLRQNAIRDEEKGMYWKDMRGGYYWYQAPIETQSLLVEAFREIASDAAIDRDLKTWLLKQKQTQSWATTKATTDACYALLVGGQNWLAEERNVSIRLGDKVVSSEGAAAGAEAGTGYFKKVFDGPFVSPSMGNISVTLSSGGTPETGSGNVAGGVKGAAVAGGGPAWGAVYWQYFENLDRIAPPDAGTAPLKLNKKIFVERNTDRGPVLEPVSENGVLHVGDKLKIRIELRSDRDLEYVHMKDMRASCTEPVNVLSGYKWQGGLGYYESTKDVGTDFFFSSLPRGSYVFEYPVFVAQNGNFSNGVTSIECMYAPEFSFHSEGIRMNVEAVNP
ncbi:MAG TPA: alpha-2-macroglobulin family protein, partial [Puia sp.]|nr:alpha-2-macroglobulin family protein [Puia sp.]